MSSPQQEKPISSPEIEEGEIIDVYLNEENNVSNTEIKGLADSHSGGVSPRSIGEETAFFNKNKRKRSFTQNDNVTPKNATMKPFKNINNKPFQKKNKITVPCRYFHINQNCIKGDKCQFSHAEITSDDIKWKMFQDQEKFIMKSRDSYGKTYVDKKFDYYLQYIKPNINSNPQNVGNASSTGMYFPGYNDITINSSQNYFNFCYPQFCIDPNVINSFYSLDPMMMNNCSNSTTKQSQSMMFQEFSLGGLQKEKENDKDNNSTSTKGDCTTKNNSFYSEKEQTSLSKSPTVEMELKKDSVEISPIQRSISLENIIENTKPTDPRLRMKK